MAIRKLEKRAFKGLTRNLEVVHDVCNLLVKANFDSSMLSGILRAALVPLRFTNLEPHPLHETEGTQVVKLGRCSASDQH